jgi:hypothetical protein
MSTGNAPPTVPRMFSLSPVGKIRPAGGISITPVPGAVDKRQAFTQAAAMVSSRSSNAIAAGRRRNKSVDNFFMDLKVVKNEVDMSLRQIITETEAAGPLSGETMEKLIRLARHFASLKASHIWYVS